MSVDVLHQVQELSGGVWSLVVGPGRVPGVEERVLLIAVLKVKARSYIAQHPVLRTVQSALHFTSLTDLFTQTPSRLLWKHPAICYN